MPGRAIELSQPPRRVAGIKPSALGDILNSLPVLTALRERFPEAHLTWVVNRAYEPLLRGHPHLDAVLPFDRGALRRGVLSGGMAFALLSCDLTNSMRRCRIRAPSTARGGKRRRRAVFAVEGISKGPPPADLIRNLYQLR